ncbi:MAG: amino acid permease [Lachnospiraceae bacterium]|nr:amino acid permease [Lachnospiraceae bacterium]
MSGVPKKSGVSALDFFCIGFGAIVGVGWAVSINNWMAGSGGPLPAAAGYIIALVMMIPIALCYCELCSMLPVSGGGMAYAFRAYGDNLSFVSGWAAFGAFITIIPWEAIYVVDILSILIPGLKSGSPLYTLAGSDIYPGHILVGTLISIILYLINRKGVTSSATLQRVLCFALVGAGILAMIFAAIKFDPANFEPMYEYVGKGSHHNFAGGSFAILASAPFFLAGFETIPQGIESAGGESKSVGKTVVLTVVLSCFFYALLLVTLGGAYPWKEFIKFDSPSAALLFKVIYKGAIGKCLYFLILTGAICGLLTTWNGFMMASSQILMAMSRVSIVPNVLAKQHPKYKTPINALKVSLVASLLGPFLGSGLIGSLTSFSAAGYVVSWTITAFCLIRLRKIEPDLERPYKIPGGVKTAWFSGIVMAILLVLLFIPGQPVYMGTMAVGLFFGWMCIGVVLFVLDYRQRQRYSQLKRASFLFASMASSSLKIPGLVDSLDDDYKVISFVIPTDTEYAGRTLMDLEWGKTQSIFILKIERGTEMLMLPNGNTKVLEGDRVFAMGLDKMVRRFSVRWDIGERFTMSTLKDFMGYGSTEKQSPLACMEIKVHGNEPYAGKALKFSGIQSEAHCMLIGIERNGEFVMMPDANMEIRIDDVLWVVGTDKNLKDLAELSEGHSDSNPDQEENNSLNSADKSDIILR